MIPIKRNCIFCDTPNGFRGNEHVISRWILGRLKALHVVEPWHKTEVLLSNDGNVKYRNTETRIANHDQIRSGYVCDQCNADLNNQLEIPFQKIQPDLLLFPFARWHQTPLLVRRADPLHKLSLNEREILSRWAAKTTCVIESVTPGRKEEQNWIQADSRLIRTEPRLPRGWVVFGMLHEPTRPTFMSGSRTWIIDPSIPESLRDGLAKSPRTVIQIGSLILVTVYLDIPGLTLRAQGTRHFPLACNTQIDWAEFADTGHGIRQTPDENPISSVNTSLRFLDTLSIGYRPENIV